MPPAPLNYLPFGDRAYKNTLNHFLLIGKISFSLFLLRVSDSYRNACAIWISFFLMPTVFAGKELSAFNKRFGGIYISTSSDPSVDLRPLTGFGEDSRQIHSTHSVLHHLCSVSWMCDLLFFFRLPSPPLPHPGAYSGENSKSMSPLFCDFFAVLFLCRPFFDFFILR